MKEIAALENISEDTLHRRFADACEKGRLLWAASIRAKQSEKTLAGSGDRAKQHAFMPKFQDVPKSILLIPGGITKNSARGYWERPQ